MTLEEAKAVEFSDDVYIRTANAEDRLVGIAGVKLDGWFTTRQLEALLVLLNHNAFDHEN